MTAGLSVLSTGMVTAVGLDAASSCAAMRAALDGFGETEFIGRKGAPVQGAPVPLPRPWIGEARLARIAAGAVVDALRDHDAAALRPLVVLCLAEKGRPGRPYRAPETLAAQILAYAGLPADLRVQVVEHGRPAGMVALRRVEDAFAAGEAGHALILGVDSYLTSGTIRHYLAEQRIMGGDVPTGFIPGEAAAAILCAGGERRHFALSGVGLAREEAFLYNPDEDPLRGDGMVRAYREALEAAGLALADIDYIIADLVGDAYFFKQSALAQIRLVRDRTDFQDMWSPGESLGNVGAAIVPLMIGQALTAWEKGYAFGNPVLIEAAADNGACGVAVFHGAESAGQAASAPRAVAEGRG